MKNDGVRSFENDVCSFLHLRGHVKHLYIRLLGHQTCISPSSKNSTTFDRIDTVVTCLNGVNARYVKMIALVSILKLL